MPGAAGPVEAHRVDADVPAAVGAELARLLHERVARAAATDELFARDVAARVARFTLDGGKRMRSQFLWWGLRAGGGGRNAEETEAALRLAAGLELIQTCALVHDDVMDGSPVRRGAAAVHASLDAQYGVTGSAGGAEPFGRAAAILVGDLALAWADDLVADLDLPAAARRRIREQWREMRTEMVAGQYLDLHGQATGSRSPAQAVRTACLKSALYSVERPLALGAALAGADEATTAALRSAGRCAGIAFQLRDDLHGVFGDPRRTGKPVGEDVREGKHTYLMAIARARAGGVPGARDLLERSVGDAGLDAEGLARVQAVLTETGARAVVETKIDRLVAQSMRHLTAAAVEPAAARRLRALLRAVAGAPAESGGEAATAPEPAPADRTDPVDQLVTPDLRAREHTEPPEPVLLLCTTPEGDPR
ncbi:polyprenyl synthetase family protein [Streptomyces sp. NPDC060194]|uniref:polyprenyl synthetase family protein n=1 Tax=Streptomyces sp. NPDC060194 TaxID=3347069 RepID=UPI00364723C7